MASTRFEYPGTSFVVLCPCRHAAGAAVLHAVPPFRALRVSPAKWGVTDAKRRHAGAHGQGTGHSRPMPEALQIARTPINAGSGTCIGITMREPRQSTNLVAQRSHLHMVTCTHLRPPCSKPSRSALSNIKHKREGEEPTCYLKNVACCGVLPWNVVLVGLSNIRTPGAGAFKQCIGSTTLGGM